MRLSFSDYDDVRNGEKNLLCNSCEGGKCQIVFDPSSVQFVLKDGESGGWASKAMKENSYRARHREHMARRERDHVFKPKLQPNFRGVETGTWKDAKEFARTEVAKDHGKKVADATARTFDPLIVKGT
jgi:hypothetical protein